MHPTGCHSTDQTHMRIPMRMRVSTAVSVAAVVWCDAGRATHARPDDDWLLVTGYESCYGSRYIVRRCGSDLVLAYVHTDAVMHKLFALTTHEQACIDSMTVPRPGTEVSPQLCCVCI